MSEQKQDYTPLNDRSDDELYGLVEKSLNGPPFFIDYDVAPERDDEDSAFVQVWVSVCAWDFPEEAVARRANRE